MAMNPNRSTAVMARRQVVDDPFDYFPTPPWATRALCEWMETGGVPYPVLADQHVWEPACGEMHMARPLAEYFGAVCATDIKRYTPDHGICDFTADMRGQDDPYDWVISNPPFIHAEAFIHRARLHSRRGFAMLVRTSFCEGQERYRSLWADRRNWPAYELQFAERVVMLRGRLIRANDPDPFNLDENAVPRKASTATSYSWLVWIHGEHDWNKRIIPPCRAQLERPDDYPAYVDQWKEAGRASMAADLNQGRML